MEMKSALRAILPLLFVSLLFWAGVAHGNVVINEVESNPAGDDEAIKTNAVAWFELYNTDDKNVDISGWSIANSKGETVFVPTGTVIRGMEYFVIDASSRWLLHSGELLVLKNATGFEVDRTAFITDEEDDEGAWTRDPDGRDTDASDDWKFLASSRGF
jgi:hypothetical protein